MELSITVLCVLRKCYSKKSCSIKFCRMPPRLFSSRFVISSRLSILLSCTSVLLVIPSRSVQMCTSVFHRNDSLLRIHMLFSFQKCWLLALKLYGFVNTEGNSKWKSKLQHLVSQCVFIGSAQPCSDSMCISFYLKGSLSLFFVIYVYFET